MSSLDKRKSSLLLVFGPAVAVTAILVGLGVIGGSTSAQSAAKPAPAPKLRGPWRMIAEAPEPVSAGRTVVWTGKEMIVSGVNPGRDGTFIEPTEVAEAYNPATNTWRRLESPPRTESFCRRSAVWTGREMLVWGCALLSFDPLANEWRRLPDPPTTHGIVAWTGRELIGWGGGCCGDVSDTGSAYDPATRTWRKLAPAPVGGQQSPAGAWTGQELVILSGHGPGRERVEGAAYDPASDSWRTIPRMPTGVQAVSYGGNLFVLGVDATATTLLSYDVRTNRLDDLGEVDPAVAVLARHQLLLWGGERHEGLAYYLELGARVPFIAPRVARRSDPALVWTGSELIVWGGVIPTRAHTSTPPEYLTSGVAFRAGQLSPPLPQCCGGG